MMRQGGRARHSGQPVVDKRAVRTIKVSLFKADVDAKLGVALENVPPGSYPRVRRVGDVGVAAGQLQTDDELMALGTKPLDVGTEAATELLRLATGALSLTVRRRQRSDDVGGLEAVVAEAEEEDEDDRRIKEALVALRSEARKSATTSASLEGVAEETACLADAIRDATMGGYRQLSLKTARRVEARCEVQKREALDAASVAAARATELRLREAFVAELEAALQEAQRQAEVERHTAVAAAIKETEERCAEEQRLAVQLATRQTQSTLGVSEEDVVASAATMAFREAAASAGAALEAAMQLCEKEKMARPKKPVISEVKASDKPDLFFF